LETERIDFSYLSFIFMPPSYDLNKIKFATDKATYQRAVDLYERGKVTDVEEALGDFTAIVQGTQPYRVSISGRRYKDAHCTCYLGQKGTLCKHAVALALHAVMNGQPLSSDNKRQRNEIKRGDRREELNAEELAIVKQSITEAMRYIKAYSGPSRTWFANQDSLQEGCARLSAIVSNLPVNKQAADILVKLLLRLDRKLMGGVDDSNGIVGGFILEVVEMLKELVQADPASIDAFKPLVGKQTCFEWEMPLVRIFEERDMGLDVEK